MAARYNPQLIRGDDYQLQFTFVRPADPDVPVDLDDPDTYVLIDYTGFTFSAQFRLFADATVLTAFSVDATDAATGVVTLSLTDTQTVVLGGKYAWDLQVVEPGGNVATYVAGVATVALDATRAVI